MRTFCILLVFACLGFNGNSQIQNLRLGFASDPISVSWMKSNKNTIVSNGRNLSISFLFKTEYYLSPYMAIASGVGITLNQGGQLQYTEGGDVWADSNLNPTSLHNLPKNVNVRSRIQYLELPVALKLRTGEFGKFRVFFEIPRLTFAATTQANGTAKTNTVLTKKQNIIASMSWLNVSYGTLMGVEYTLSENISALFGIHYKQGIFDITDNSGVDSRITTGSLGLCAGILF